MKNDIIKQKNPIMVIKQIIGLISCKMESNFGSYDGLGSLVTFESILVLVVIKTIYLF
jgi:hypothetical protein